MTENSELKLWRNNSKILKVEGMNLERTLKDKDKTDEISTNNYDRKTKTS